MNDTYIGAHIFQILEHNYGIGITLAAGKQYAIHLHTVQHIGSILKFICTVSSCFEQLHSARLNRIGITCQAGLSKSLLGGILSHTVGPDGVILGIGLNVAMRSEDLPVPQASSVLLEGGDPDRAALLVDLMAALATRVAQWRGSDPALMEDYRRACSSIGRLVDIDLPDGHRVSGMVAGVDDDGHLLVSDGEATARITSGDVVHATI